MTNDRSTSVWQVLCEQSREDAPKNDGRQMAHSVSHFVSEIFSSADHLEYLGLLEIISFLIAMAMIVGACGAILVLILIYLV